MGLKQANKLPFSHGNKTRRENHGIEIQNNLIYLLEGQKMAIITGKISVNNIVSVRTGADRTRPDRTGADRTRPAQTRQGHIRPVRAGQDKA